MIPAFDPMNPAAAMKSGPFGVPITRPVTIRQDAETSAVTNHAGSLLRPASFLRDRLSGIHRAVRSGLRTGIVQTSGSVWTY